MVWQSWVLIRIKIKNNKLLSDLLEKEKSYTDREEESDGGYDDSTDSNEEEETDNEGSQPEESQNSEEAEDSDSTLIQRKVTDPCQHCN